MKRIKRFAIGTVLIFAIILSAFSFTAYGNENAVTSTDVPLSKISTDVKEKIANGDTLLNVRLTIDNDVVDQHGFHYRELEGVVAPFVDEFCELHNIPKENYEYVTWDMTGEGVYLFAFWLTPEQIASVANDDMVISVDDFRTFLWQDWFYKSETSGKPCVEFTSEDALTVLQVAVDKLDQQNAIVIGNPKCLYLPYHLYGNSKDYDVSMALLALQSSVGITEVLYYPIMFWPE